MRKADSVPSTPHPIPLTGSEHAHGDGEHRALPYRRTLLGAAAAAPLAALPIAAGAGAVGGDAELLRLAAEFQRYQDRYLELTLRHANVVHIPAEVEAELDAMRPIKLDLAEQIADMHAATLAGLRAKAAILLAFGGYKLDGTPAWKNRDELLGWSIARDLLGDEAAKAPEEQARWASVAGRA